MADGAQRLLDVIDDPNALESFLGGLTSDTELLPSAETVDNVVASLARSLDENEYEVDSPNETLFDTLDSSSSHLTDISRSYVPSDFGHVAVQNDPFGSNLDAFSNGNSLSGGNISQQQQEHQTSQSGCDQFIGSSTANTLINSVISAASSMNASTNNLKQITSSVTNCDPSKTNNFVQSGQIQLTQNSVSSASNSLNFDFSHDLQQQLKHNSQVSVSQNQVTSLSSISVDGQTQQSVPSTNSLISVVGSSNQNGVAHTLTDSTSNFQVVANQQQQQSAKTLQQQQQNLLANTSLNTSANNQVTSGITSTVTNATAQNDSTASSIASNSVNLSTNTNVVGSTASALQQQAQQFLANTSSAAAVNQLVAGQTVSIPNMTVSTQQLLASTQGGIMTASTGQNILQQIQSAGGGQSYIAMEQPTALIAAGPTTFGTNVALVATGGTPTYAVLPTTPQFLTNAIIPQSIQTLTKTANGAYFQTAGTPQIVTTNVNAALQNVSSSAATSTYSSTLTSTPVSSVSTSVDSGGGSTAQQSAASSSVSNTAVTDSVVSQIIQQSQQQLSTVSGATGTVALTPQQQFAIGNAAGIGQVVVSQVSNLTTMTTPQQQLAGTIVVNQYGQPMLLPAASTTQAGALQFILRQQATQPQVLTIQTPNGPATISTQATAQAAASGKPIVRYVSQVPQVAQSGYGLQQIQTANGPALIAVRYPQQASQPNQFSQIQADSLQSSAIQNQITAAANGTQPQTVQIQLPQQQAQQLLQQSQQQSQIQLQAGMQSTQQLQVQQNANAQLQLQAQQHLSLQSPSNQQQGQMSNAQLQQNVSGQQQILQQQHLSQSVLPQTIQMDGQNNAASQQNHYQPNQTPANNQSQTQSQNSRDNEQQLSVPDSSSEPPPPKKAKTKPKSSKKKGTIDLEQLLKQSGIMDEDLNDDMSFGDFFSMDTTSNGFPPSPQVPPAQIPVINTTEVTKKASSKKSKSNAKKNPVKTVPPPPVPQPPPPVPVVAQSPTTQKKKSSSKKKNSASILPPATPPPPPVVAPPPPIVTTPTSSKSSKKKASKRESNSVSENVKSEPVAPVVSSQTSTPTPSTPKSRSKKNEPPKKFSSLDTLLATIDAVAAAAGASASPPRVPTPPYAPPSVVSTPTPVKPSPKSKSKSKKKEKAGLTTAVKSEPPPVPTPSLLPSQSNMTSLPVQSPTPNFSQAQPLTPLSSNSTVFGAPSPGTPSMTQSLPNAGAPNTRPTGPGMTNGNGAPMPTAQQPGLTRIVQTIQLTPHNQQLLRNIQAQIQKLCALPRRTDSEQSALQKLVTLQQQVIATGIPVANPAHLTNLAQSVNVEPISLGMPSTSVPSDSTTASSTNLPLVSLEYEISPNPVSSTVMTSTAFSAVLANSSVNNSTSSNSVPSPQLVQSNATSSLSGGGGGGGSSASGALHLGSPSVSSATSPDSTSNHTNHLTIDQCTVQPSSNLVTNAAPSANTSTAHVASSGAIGVGSVVVSNVKTDLEQLVASVAVASHEDSFKDNTHGAVSQGVPMQPPPAIVPVSTTMPMFGNTTNQVPFSQHLPQVPVPSPYTHQSFPAARSVVDEKKAEEQRQANLRAEEEKRARWKKEEFEMLLQRDQQYVVKPDYEVPFSDRKDAVERLMKYHIYRDRNEMEFEDFDSEFANNATILLDKFSVMMSKYRNLLLKESMKEVGSAERVMLERMFVNEEKARIEHDRHLVAQGDVLDLPAPPESWKPKIKEMVDKEMMEFVPQDPVVSQQVQSAIDSIIGCETDDPGGYTLEEGDKIEYDAFGVPISSSGYGGLGAASSADIDEAVRSILS